MIKEIKYNGYTANPSDYECPDGDLATSIGVIPEDGSLKPILPPSEVFRLESGASVMYIHETANIKHYIIFKTMRLVGGTAQRSMNRSLFVHSRRYTR